MEGHPELLGTVCALGALIFIAVRQALVWAQDRETSHLPWFAITLCGVVFAITRVVHLIAGDTPLAMTMIRCQFAIGMLLPGLSLATVEVIGGLPLSRGTRLSLAVAVPLQILCIVTGWIVAGPLEPHTDPFGHLYYGAHTGWMVILIAPVCIAVAVGMRRRVRALPPPAGNLRRSFRILVALFSLTALHDTLVGAGVLRSVFLLEYAFVACGVIAASFEVRRTFTLRYELEEVVARKRAELAQQTANLDEAARRLESSESRYRNLANSTREGVILCKDSVVLDANRAVDELLGVDERTLLGADLRELIAAPDWRAVERLLRGEPGPIELTLQPANRAPVIVSIQAMPPPKLTIGTRVLLIRDISGERDLQSRLAISDRLAAVGTLAAGTAHEINNPLTFVLTSTELLAEEIARNATRIDPALVKNWTDLCAEAASGVDRIRRVVSDLMSLARDREGDETTVDLGRTLDRCLTMANPHLRHRATVVRDYLATKRVLASEGRLFQVFLNLIVNAAQAIPEGHVADNHIRIATRDAGERVVVEITDTGSGMAPAVLARIFTPFYTTKAIGQGTGLGLSISQGIVAALGGTIDVSSEVGRGTTFRVDLPVAGPLEKVRATSQGLDDPPPALRILIVDDEARVATGLARGLTSLGHDVHIAHSGRIALEKLDAHQFDVALCDLMMPDVTGMELYARLVDANHAIVPRLVFMTGGSFSDEARAFLEQVGTTRWLSKPIPMDRLRRVVRDVSLR